MIINESCGLERRGGLMVSALDSGSSGPSPGRALRCVLGQDTLQSTLSYWTPLYDGHLLKTDSW